MQWKKKLATGLALLLTSVAANGQKIDLMTPYSWHEDIGNGTLDLVLETTGVANPIGITLSTVVPFELGGIEYANAVFALDPTFFTFDPLTGRFDLVNPLSSTNPPTWISCTRVDGMPCTPTGNIWPIPASDYVVLALGSMPMTVASGDFFVRTPPPVISTISPSSFPAGQDTVLTVSGSNLGTTVQAYLEISRGSYELTQINPSPSGTSVQVTVPAGLDPGTYRLRVLTERGGASFDESDITVTVPTTENPEVNRIQRNGNPLLGAFINGTGIVEIRGTGFTGATSAVLRPTNVSTTALDVPLNNMTVIDNRNITANLPGGMQPGCYDIIVTVPRGGTPVANSFSA